MEFLTHNPPADLAELCLSSNALDSDRYYTKTALRIDLLANSAKLTKYESTHTIF